MKTLYTALTVAAVAAAVLVQSVQGHTVAAKPAVTKPVAESDLVLSAPANGQYLLAGSVCINHCSTRVNK